MNFKFASLSLNTKIALLLLTLMVPLALLRTWALANSAQDAKEAAHSHVHAVAAHATADVQRFLQQSEHLLARMAARPLIRALNPKTCDPLIAEFVAFNPQFDSLGLFDAGGTLVCADPLRPIEPLAGQARAGFETARASGGFWAGSASRQPGDGRWVSQHFYPVRDEAGKTVGMLVVAVDLLNLSRQLNHLLSDNALLAVSDGNGLLLIRSAELDAPIGTHDALANIAPAPGADPSIVTAADPSGNMRLFTSRAIPVVGWTLTVGLPEAEMFSQYRASFWRAVGIGIFAWLMAFGLGWRLMKSIANPMLDLAATAAGLAAGEPRTRARLDGPPEVRAVAQQLNNVLDARDLSEAALRTSEARLRTIFQSATEAILLADHTQHIVDANGAAATMFGCKIESLIGAPLQQFIPERHRAEHDRHVRDFSAGKITSREMGFHRDVAGLRADGREFPIEASISHLRIDGEQLYTVILRDLSERLRVQAALRESEAGLRRLLTLLPEAVIVTSANRITFVNDAAQRLLGADKLALLGRSPLEQFHAESLLVNSARLLAQQSSGVQAPLIEEQIVRPDGSIRIVETTATVIEGRGTVSILAVMRDVTQLKQAQSALAQSHADLQRLLAAQDKIQEDERMRIARELHDDLQQTLAAIKIDLGTIAMRLTADAPAVSPLLAEVDDLATAAIVSTRRIVNDLRPQMLEDLGLLAALEMLASQFSQRTGIACRLDAQSQADNDASGDPNPDTDPDTGNEPGDGTGNTTDSNTSHAPSQAVTTCLYRVAQESLNNVAKHAGASTVLIKLARTPEGDFLLRVADNGSGMDPSQRAKPESFGLQSMYERVRALGGVLKIDSQTGAGVTVEARIPAVPTSNAAPSRLRRRREDPPSFNAGTALETASEAATQTSLTSGSGQHSGRESSHELGHELDQPLQSIIDALTGHVAVLDHEGAILLVNRAWREFGEQNGAPGWFALGAGVNYLEVCQRSALSDKSALPALEGLRDLLAGRRDMFVSEYACHSLDEQRWFRMHAAQMSDGKVLVTHLRLTGRVVPVRAQELFGKH